MDTEAVIMTVCITTATTEPGARMDARFGRSPYFTFVETDSGEVTIEENPFAGGSSGVGARVGQFVAEHGTRALITAQVGPSAHAVLEAAGIDAYVSHAETVHDALAEFKEGKLERIVEPSDAKHSGRS